MPPTSAVSSGVASMPISKSVSWTVVAPLVSAIPPLWAIVPANVLASSLPPVIGKASESLPIGAAAMPRLCSAFAAPGSSVTVVAPPVSATVLGLAVTATVPSRRPFLNSVVWNVALSALAAALVSRTRTPVIFVSSPARVILALLVSSVRSVTRAPPTRPDSVEAFPSLTVNELSVSRVRAGGQLEAAGVLDRAGRVRAVERAAGDLVRRARRP